jgi:WD40 repeat protein
MKGYSTQRNFQLKKPIINASFYESKYYIVDSHHTLIVLNEDFTTQLRVKLLKDKEEAHHYHNSYCISNGITSIAKANSTLCAKYENEKVKLIYNKKHEHGDIVYTILNETASMLLSCSRDGKASIFNTISKFYCYTFEYQPDHCSCAFFSSRDLLVFVGYYNNENKVLNLKDLSLIEFKLTEPVESGVFFDNDSKLFLADRVGNSVIYDCVNDKILSKKAVFNEWVSCTKLYKEKYLLAGTRKNKLYIVNLIENEIVAVIELSFYGVTSINIEKEKLILTYADANFEIIELDYQKENFILHLNLQEYKEAKELIKQNLFLNADENIEKFESGFHKVIKKIKELISKEEIEDALELAEPFMDNLKFKDELDLLFMQKDYIAKFIEAVEKNDINTAYTIAEKYDVIKTLGAYQTIEKQFNRAFSDAKKIIEKDNIHGKNKAREILKAYERVPAKSELVKHLISNNDKFILAEKLVKAQSFEKYFMLINTYKFLKDTLLYKKIDTLALSLQTKAFQSFSKGNLDDAIKLYKQLIVFPEYTDYAKENITSINAEVKLKNLVEDGKIQAVYKHIEKYPKLAFSTLFLDFNTSFEKDLQNAQTYIEKQKMSEAIDAVSKYFSIKYLDDKISNLFKHVYLLEIEDNELSEYDITKVILTYQKLFKIDDRIKDLFKNKGLENEFHFALKSQANVKVEKYPETILIK